MEREALLGDPTTLPAGVDRRDARGDPAELDFLEEERAAMSASSSNSRTLCSAASFLALISSRFACNLACLSSMVLDVTEADCDDTLSAVSLADLSAFVSLADLSALPGRSTETLRATAQARGMELTTASVVTLPRSVSIFLAPGSGVP